MKVLLHPPKKHHSTLNFVQLSFVSLKDPWKTLLGLNTLPKRRLVPELLGFLEESPLWLTNHLREIIQNLFGWFFPHGESLHVDSTGNTSIIQGGWFFRRSSCRRFFRFVWETKSGVFGWEIRRIWISKVRSWWNSKKVDWKKKEKHLSKMSPVLCVCFSRQLGNAWSDFLSISTANISIEISFMDSLSFPKRSSLIEKRSRIPVNGVGLQWKCLGVHEDTSRHWGYFQQWRFLIPRHLNNGIVFTRHAECRRQQKKEPWKVWAYPSLLMIRNPTDWFQKRNINKRRIMFLHICIYTHIYKKKYIHTFPGSNITSPENLLWGPAYFQGQS